MLSQHGTMAIMAREFDENQLDRVKLYVASVPEGKALLDLADRQDCAISYSPKLQLLSSAGVLEASYDEPHNKCTFSLKINPFRSISQQVRTLCHELRHLWQYEEVEDWQKFEKLSPSLTRAYVRVTEADAYVFEMHMAKTFNAATDLRLSFQSKAGNKVLDTLASVVGVDTPSFGLLNPLERYRHDVDWKSLYEGFQAGSKGKDYDVYCTKNREAAVRAKDFSRDGLKEFFNVTSFDGVMDLKNILRMGLDENAPFYHNVTSNKRLVQETLQHVHKKHFKSDLKVFRG